MDEIFHVPQSDRYCRGILDWDPKITTFPGLYLVSAPIARLLSPVFSSLQLPHSCSTPWLYRIINGFLALETHRQLARLEVLVTGGDSLAALVLSLYPIHAFFSVLYYTDVGSLLFIVAAYRYSLEGKEGSRLLGEVPCPTPRVPSFRTCRPQALVLPFKPHGSGFPPDQCRVGCLPGRRPSPEDRRSLDRSPRQVCALPDTSASPLASNALVSMTGLLTPWIRSSGCCA